MYVDMYAYNNNKEKEAINLVEIKENHRRLHKEKWSNFNF